MQPTRASLINGIIISLLSVLNLLTLSSIEGASLSTSLSTSFIVLIGLAIVLIGSTLLQNNIIARSSYRTFLRMLILITLLIIAALSWQLLSFYALLPTNVLFRILTMLFSCILAMMVTFRNGIRKKRVTFKRKQ